ncbi:aminotransferase [Salinibacterium sp. ZJ70]|uniref:aminotransferase n=1 Tax=Salinibacterium sp. ZJ70 TaxID=2708084 RepID=UPI00142164A2|nr:aminotransferase [Salinibacterium sp. ZJ70]
MSTSESVDFSLPRPNVGIADATRVLRELWGLDADTAVELGSQQDRNFRVDTPEGRFVLKLGNPGLPIEQLRLQHLAFERIATAAPEIAVPAARQTLAGDDLALAHVDGVELPVRCVTWIEGTPLTELPPSPALATSLGETAARVAAALAGLPHEEAPRTGWDLRLASDLVRELTPSIPDPDERARVTAAAERATERLRDLADRLPVQLIHGDITDDNVVADAAGERISGVIDFGDLSSGWRVAELAVGTTTLLAHTPGEPWRVLDQVRAFDAITPLDDAEIRALWPLVTLRAAVLVAAAHHQLALDDDNPHVSREVDRNATVLRTALETRMDEAALVLRAALRPLADAPAATASLLHEGTAVTHLDLSVYSSVWDAGAWLDGGTAGAEAERTREPGSVVATRHGEARPDHGIALSSTPPRSVSLGVSLFLDAGTPLAAPFAGEARVDEDGTLVLAAGGAELRIDGARDATTGAVAAGDPLGTSGERLRIAAARLPGLTPPTRIRASERALWAEVCPDPLAWIGIEAPSPDPGVPSSTAVPASALLERREAAFARVHERYFANPPRIERGWRHYLLDEDGRSYLDIVNNVAAVGHGHPRIAEAAAAQWRRLNTNSRFHYGELVRYSERLAALAPEGLDTVFLVNSGTEAVDLAIRLVRAATGRPTVIGLREAYHGWSMASDAVSSSLNDNPHALSSRPDWVRLADVPNPVRGTYRGPDSGPAYVADFAELVSQLVAEGAPPAGVIGEAVFGNGGGVLLPDGYLAGVYAAVRAAGGLCIADEVQVGFGRLGHHFWAFEQQGAVPDVITIAKSIGNGQPLGAVITTRAIAEAFAAEGSFFSSAGGSPVSCVVGNTVLDILEDEQLIENARIVGDHLRDGLAALGAHHPSVGAVHGMGLYLGLELVSDRDAMTADGALATAVCEGLLTEGVIVLPTGDGKNVLKIKPPMTLTAADADYFVERLDAVLTRLRR